MPTGESSPFRRAFVDLSPLRVSPAFARLWIGQSVSGIGAWLTLTAVGWFIFDITGSTFAVSLVGGISLLPMIAAGLWGGTIVDAFDRRTVAIVASSVSWLSTLSLVALAAADLLLQQQGARIELWPLYLVTTVNAVATTISGATRSALIPRILPEDMVSRAAALNGLTFGLQLTVGPLLAGFLVAAFGFPVTFAIDAVLFTAGFLGILGLPRMPPLTEVVRPGLKSLADGLRFLAQAPNLRMSFIVDIVAMTLGRPIVLFPALSVGVIGGGTVTAGVLAASIAVGTMLAGLFSGPVARIHRHGVAITRAIIVFGAFTALFGLLVLVLQLVWPGLAGPGVEQLVWPALALACLLLAGTGASDQFSAVFRTTMLLTAAPDEMRGRLQGIFMVVVAGGPRVGDLFAGALATLVGLWAAPLIGGIAIMAIIWMLARMSPGWRAYDAQHPTP